MMKFITPDCRSSSSTSKNTISEIYKNYTLRFSTLMKGPLNFNKSCAILDTAHASNKTIEKVIHLSGI